MTLDRAGNRVSDEPLDENTYQRLETLREKAHTVLDPAVKFEDPKLTRLQAQAKKLAADITLPKPLYLGLEGIVNQAFNHLRGMEGRRVIPEGMSFGGKENLPIGGGVNFMQEIQKSRRPMPPIESTADTQIMARFLDPDTPCFFKNCEQLRKDLDMAITAAGGVFCSSCELSRIRTQFAKRAVKLARPSPEK